MTSNIGFVYTGHFVILTILLTTRGFQNLFHSPNFSSRLNGNFRRRSILFRTPQRPLILPRILPGSHSPYSAILPLESSILPPCLHEGPKSAGGENCAGLGSKQVRSEVEFAAAEGSKAAAFAQADVTGLLSTALSATYGAVTATISDPPPSPPSPPPPPVFHSPQASNAAALCGAIMWLAGLSAACQLAWGFWHAPHM